MKAVEKATKGFIKLFAYFGVTIAVRANDMPIVTTIILSLVMIAIGYTTIQAIKKEIQKS
jgi:hypothetical protein